MTALRRAQGLLLSGAIVILWNGAGVEPAHAELSFDASATAYGNLVTAENPSVPLGVSVDETAPESRARLTSLGDSSALAAGPYFGDTLTDFVFAQPGANGLGAQDYPLVVSTVSGERPKDMAAPGVELHAESGQSLASATANLGQPSSGSTSRSRVEQTQDGLRSTAVTSTDGLVLFDKLRLGTISAEASTLVDGSGRRTSAASMAIAHLTAEGLSITVPKTVPPPLGGMTITGPDLGFVDGAFTVTLPGVGPRRFPVPTQSIQDGLKAIGVSMSFQAALRTPTGIVAPTVTFGAVLPAPPSNPQYDGPTPVTVTFGRASTSVAAHNLPDAGAPVVGGFTGGADSPGADSPGAATPVTSAPLQPGSLSLPGTATGPAPLTTAAPPRVAPDGSASLAAAAAPATADLVPVYLLIVAVAAVAFGSATVLRVLGVRGQWAS
jgi:hypothetical protein